MFVRRFCYCLILLSFYSPLLAAKPACQGGVLQKWAINAGYPTDYCLSGTTSTDGSSGTTTNTTTETRNPCREDGTLAGWARREGYDPALCVATTGSGLNTSTETTPAPAPAPEQPVPNTAPTLAIITPLTGTQLDAGSNVQFSASAQDNEDGNISHSVSWRSSLDGVISNSSLLSVGQHTITATVTDSGGLSANQTINLTVSALQPSTSSAILSWNTPTQRENGQPLTMAEIKGYEVYMVGDSSAVDATIVIESNAATSYTFDSLTPDTYHFSIVTIDSTGATSQMSEIVSMTIQ